MFKLKSKAAEHCFLNYDCTLQPSSEQLEQIDLKLVAELFPENDPEEKFEKLFSGKPETFRKKFNSW